MIIVRDLNKSFIAGKRRIDAVRGLSFTAADCAITGLLGPNGAGKTTTLRVIATLVMPDSGGASVDGLDCDSDALGVRAALGVLSDARGLYTRLTARENTERPITIDQGTNTLIGVDPARLIAAVDDVLTTGGKKGRAPDLWDGRAAERIADATLAFLQRGREAIA